MFAALLLTLLAFSVSFVTAVPVRKRGDSFSSLINSLTPRSGTTPAKVSTADQTKLGLELAAAAASAAYCDGPASLKWECAACDRIPDMQVLYASGDGTDHPRLFVGASASLGAVVISHEGTQSNLAAWASDLTLDLTDLDVSLDNGRARSRVQVHEGFQNLFLNLSSAVLEQVDAALSGPGSFANRVLVVGHSLGGALAVLDGMHLRLQRPELDVDVITFGQPRVGNAAFARYAASVLGGSFVHYINDNDLVPRLPPEWTGYSQVVTELWYNGDGSLMLCPGLENEACSRGVSDFDLSIFAHLGPYFDDIHMGTQAC